MEIVQKLKNELKTSEYKIGMNYKEYMNLYNKYKDYYYKATQKKEKNELIPIFTEINYILYFKKI